MTDIEKLREIALDQHGMITSAQAEEVGVSRPALTYLVKNNRIDRLERGIYRIPQVNATENDGLQQALLWAGADSYLSHDTALMAWDICDINPTQIHLTIPKRRRIQKEGHDEVVLHKEGKLKAKLKWWDGMPTAAPYDAISQSMDKGVSSHLLNQAIEHARAKGLIDTAQTEELRDRLEKRVG